jgi:hypothetical protein
MSHWPLRFTLASPGHRMLNVVAGGFDVGQIDDQSRVGSHRHDASW